MLLVVSKRQSIRFHGMPASISTMDRGIVCSVVVQLLMLVLLYQRCIVSSVIIERVNEL